MSRHFDVAVEETEPITFTWKGETYRCRGEAPALPVLKGMRAQLAGGLEQEAGNEVVLELMEAVFEPGELDRILRTGISVRKLMEIVQRVLAILNGEDEGDEGEAPAPLPGQPNSPSAPSSSASTSSRPTSNASTTTTSGASSAAA